jgi:hypothetical protein
VSSAVAERSSSKSLPTLAVELKDLVVAYAKQETLEPIKGLGRFLAFGVAGSILVALGLFLLTLGVIRVIQVEAADYVDGNFSWVPYLAGLVFCVVVMALAARGIGTAKRRREAASR